MTQRLESHSYYSDTQKISLSARRMLQLELNLPRTMCPSKTFLFELRSGTRPARKGTVQSRTLTTDRRSGFSSSTTSPADKHSNQSANGCKRCATMLMRKWPSSLSAIRVIWTINGKLARKRRRSSRRINVSIMIFLSFFFCSANLSKIFSAFVEV